MARHRSASPDCPFILNESNNVPIIQQQQSNTSSGGGNMSEDASGNDDQVDRGEQMDRGKIICWTIWGEIWCIFYEMA